MNRFFYLILLCIFFSSTKLIAQQDIFAVPFPEIVEEDKWYFQPGITVDDQLTVNAVFTYGLGRNYEIGLAVEDMVFNYEQGEELIPWDTLNPEENPALLINFQKAFELSQDFALGIGTRSGINMGAATDFATFNYLNVQLLPFENDSRFVAGAYYTNEAYADEGNALGFMLGTEIPILEDQLDFMADVISGTSALSSLRVGLNIHLPSDLELAIGARIPYPGSGNPYGISIQLNN